MLTAASRILVLVPHPDDEVVGFSALIGRARADGARVFTLMLTDGVPATGVLWPWQRRGRSGRAARRRAEAQAAAAALGAEPAGFLDIPTRRLKDEYGTARRAVAEALASLRPEALWVPAYEGGHQDHDVASLLASTFRRDVPVFEAPLYNFAGGRVNSQSFIGQSPDTREIALTPAESAAKRRQLALYASERGNLDYVGVEREGLRPQPVHDYSRPPHAGRAFYQRFQWVPFRHPRIDFTTPGELCRAMTGLAGP